LAIHAEQPVAWNNLGALHHSDGRRAVALTAYRRGAALGPASGEIWFNAAASADAERHYGMAYRWHGRSLAIDRGREAAALARARLADLLGDLPGARRAYRLALEANPGSLQASRALLLSRIFDSELDGPTLRSERQDWCRRFLPSRPLTLPPRDRDPERRLRLGVLGGPNLRGNTHAFVALPGLECLIRRDFEVFVYSDIPADAEDAFTQRYRRAADGWRLSAGLDDDALAQGIAEDRIDILVDLVGHLGGPRFSVLARRPAPVQILNLALATSGLDAADWLIADSDLVPSEHEAHFCERILRLPQGYVYDPLVAMPPVVPPPAAARGRVTFGSTNALVKITGATVALWSAVLQRVPNSRLLIKGSGFSESNVRARFTADFARHGIAAERIELRPWTPSHVEHLHVLNEIDIVLDATPYSGVTTTCEALWMGLPVVTLVGDRMAGRYGLAVLRAAGIADGLAQTPSAYVDDAARLAADIDALARRRRAQRARIERSALADREGYGRALSDAYRRAWRHRCRS
jgi:predicted O-linked N-acetylglucosamine transferase (SPINDLY family)